MEKISDFELFLKCRLCGVNGLHEMDILEIDASSGPDIANALSEKIFRCVGIRVGRNDKLTTKICGNCSDKINEFVVFRKTCTATDIQLRLALSTVTLTSDDSSIDTVWETTSTQISSRGYAGLNAMTGRICAVDPAEVNTSKRFISAANESGNVRSAAVAFNETERAMEAPHACRTTVVVPTTYTSLTDDETEDDGDDVNIAHGALYTQGVPTKTQVPANSKTIVNYPSFKIKCVEYQGKCNEIFDSWDAMMYHTKSFHADAIKNTFDCHLCKKSFAYKGLLLRHIQSVHTGLKPFKCPNRSCSIRMSEKSHLTQHIKSVHSGLRPFQCPNQSCLKKYSSKEHLKRHIDSLHSGLKPFRCPNQSCLKKFSWKSSLTRHIDSVHSGLKPFQCPSCLKKFSMKSSLTRHIDSVHSGLKPFQCPSCLKKFSGKSSLTRHIDSVHSDLKPFQCPNQSCSKNFSCNSNLKRHINALHSGPRPS